MVIVGSYANLTARGKPVKLFPLRLRYRNLPRRENEKSIPLSRKAL